MIVPYYLVFSSLFVLSTLVCSTLFFSLHLYHILHIAAEKAMAPHSSTLAWKIPWTEESGRLQFMGSLRVGHD